jgi:hypothetical protein
MLKRCGGGKEANESEKGWLSCCDLLLLLLSLFSFLLPNFGKWRMWPMFWSSVEFFDVCMSVWGVGQFLIQVGGLSCVFLGGTIECDFMVLHQQGSKNYITCMMVCPPTV